MRKVKLMQHRVMSELENVLKEKIVLGNSYHKMLMVDVADNVSLKNALGCTNCDVRRGIMLDQSTMEEVQMTAGDCDLITVRVISVIIGGESTGTFAVIVL